MNGKDYIRIKKEQFPFNLRTYASAITIVNNKGYYLKAYKQTNNMYKVAVWKNGNYLKLGDFEYADEEEGEYVTYMNFADKLSDN